MLQRRPHPMQPVKRPSFSSAQKKAARDLGRITDADRQARRQITSHAIDNVTPDIQADRDDAIHVDTTPDGDGYLIETTIADVAGTVPLTSPLANVAHTRAYTRYREFWNDPMFPKALEDRMSLEHGKERRGLTVRSWRDKQLNTTHIEFERTLCVGDNVDYAMAQERIQQRDPEFTLMSEVGQGLRERMKHASPRAVDELVGERAGGRMSAKAFHTRKMVEAYMLAANADVATFMTRARLPYIYRNFEDELVGDDGIARAYYSVHSRGHDALRRDGLEGEYGHFTSPIRRGADYYNAHMVHYVIDCVELLEQRLMAAAPALDRAALHHRLWQYAPDMLALQSHMGQGASTRLWGEMARHLQRCLPAGTEIPLQGIAREFLKRKPPLTHPQLSRYVESINALVGLEQKAMQDPQIQGWIKRREAVRSNDDAYLELKALSADQISMRHPTEFSQLLARAAKQGIMSDALRDEAIARLAMGEENATIARRLTEDAFNILIVAPQQGDWLPLKRAACRAIKNNSDIVNGVFERADAEGYLPKHAQHLSRANLTTSRDAALNRSNSLEAALLTYQLPDRTVVAPPFYSVGHDAQAASSHANFSFLERYAFGELRPVDQAHYPNLLYADLNMPHADRAAIIEQMLEQRGAHFRVVEYTDRKNVHHARAIAKGGDLKEALVASASSDESADPVSSAARRLLRQDAFKEALHFPELAELRSSLRPMERLEQCARARGITVEEETVPAARGARSRFCTTITLHSHGITKEYQGMGPKKTRARHDAAVKALKDWGWLEDKSMPGVRSWVEDVEQAATTPALSAGR